MAEEWSEPCEIPGGQNAQMIYLFDEDDITNSDGEPLEAEFYPWDADHCARVILDP